jgi:hypothetical protein
MNHISVSASRLRLRLDRDLISDKVSALYSLDGTNWMIIGQTWQALTNAQVCIWTGGSPSGFPNCDLWRLDIVASATPLNPILAAQPQHLVFNAVAGQPCTNLQQLRVVARRALASQSCGITSSAPWLSASVALTNTPASCDVAVDTTGLAVGKYDGTLTFSAPGATSAVATVTLIVNPAVRAQVATWRGAKAGAMTVWMDDSEPTAFEELSTNGFQGTYMLMGATSIPPWVTNYYQAGMEFGGHTVDHICSSLDDPTMRYELETNIASINALTPQASNQLITLAFPCGYAPISSRVIAADYYLAVHGYNINQFEDASPYDFMNLKTFNSHEHAPNPPANFKPLVDAAIAQGKWYNMVLHATNNSDGAISYASGRDIWVATGGAVSKYILQRDRTYITNYQESAGQIRFSFGRLAFDASSVRNFEAAASPQDLLTFQVDITGANAAYSLALDGIASPCSVKTAAGRTLAVFDALVTTNTRTAFLQVLPNRAPTLPVQPNLTVSQYAAMTVANTAADLDVPPQALTYTLVNPPLGAQIDSQGVITWTPGAVPGLGTYSLTTVASDNGQPSLSATNSFTVTVVPPNWLQLPTVPDLTLVAGQTLLVTNAASSSQPRNPWATNSILFGYTNREALLADGWDFLANTPGIGQRNTEITNPAAGAVISYDQTLHPGIVRIPCDLGDLWAGGNSSRNALFRNLPANWRSLRLSMAFTPSQDVQQVHLSCYQDDDNYLQAGFAFNQYLGGECATLILETNANPNHFYDALYMVTNIDLRLDCDATGANLTGWYSLDHTNWSALGTYPQTLTNPRLGIWAGGSPYPWTNGLPTVDLQQLTVVTSNTVASVINYTLLNAPPGATIDTNGVITWTPDNSAGPSTNVFTTIVTNDGQPPVSATNSFLVTVKGWLTVSAIDQTRLYGATNPMLSGTLWGVLSNDNITASFATSATISSPVGAYSIVPVLDDPDQRLTNYVVLATNGTLTVAAAPLTITADNQSRMYGGTNPVWTVSYSGFVNGEDASVLTGTLIGGSSAQVDNPVGNYPITVSGLGASNYSLQYLPGTLTITPAPLIVTANDQTRSYGQTNPVLTVRYSGFVNGEDASRVTGALLGNTIADVESPVGQYPITVSGQSAPNYNLSYVAGMLTVAPASLLVVAQDATRVYGQTNPLFAATCSGYVNGDTSNVLGGQLTLATSAQSNSPVGLYPIVPSGIFATNYSVIYSNGTLRITPYALQVVADNQTRSYGAPNPPFTGLLSGVLPGDAISADYVAAATTNTPVGNCDIVPVLIDPNQRLTNYSVTQSNGVLTITPATLVAAADNQYRTYGETNPVLSGTLTGLVPGDLISLVCTSPATPATPVGSYPISPTLVDPANRLTNYSVSTSGATLWVYHAQLVARPDDQSRIYGTDNPSLTCTLTGLQNNDDISAFCWTTADLASPPGEYGIFAYLDDPDMKVGNYLLDSQAGTLTVAAAPSVLRLTSSLNPSMAGESVTFTAAVAPAPPSAGIPGGVVQFFTNGVAVSDPVALNSAVASVNFAALPAGSHAATAVYMGDGNFLSSSNNLMEVVGQRTVMLSISNIGDGTVAVVFQGDPQANWVLEATTNPAAADSWFGVSTNTLGADGFLATTNSVGTQPQLFFRARSP